MIWLLTSWPANLLCSRCTARTDKSRIPAPKPQSTTPILQHKQETAGNTSGSSPQRNYLSKDNGDPCGECIACIFGNDAPAVVCMFRSECTPSTHRGRDRSSALSVNRKNPIDFAATAPSRDPKGPPSSAPLSIERRPY